MDKGKEPMKIENSGDDQNVITKVVITMALVDYSARAESE